MIDFTKIIIASLIVGAISTASYFYGEQSARNEMLEDYNIALQQKQVINDKLSNQLILTKQQNESNYHDLQNQTALLNDSLSKCNISNQLLRKFKQSAGQVPNSSELSNTHDGELADNQGDSRLTAEDLSENYILASSNYVSCAKQYNQLLEILGY